MDAKSGSQNQISSSSISLDKKATPIVHLDTFHVSGGKHESSFGDKLLAVHEDGVVGCYSENLESLEWSAGIKSGSLAQEPADSAGVEFASILSVEQAQKTILKSREDLLVTVQKGSNGLDGSLLLLVSRSRQSGDASGHGSLDLRVLGLDAANVETKIISPAGCNSHELASLVIPEPSHLRSESTRFTLHAASGTLYQLGDKVMIIYDLTGSTPQVAHELTLDSTLSSCLQISPGLLACCTPRTLSIVDSTYHSLQDSLAFSRNTEASPIRKTSETSSDQPANDGDAKLLSYFAPLDLVVALEGRKLLAIQLSRPKSQDGRLGKRKRDASLAVSVGKGYSLATQKLKGPGTSERKIKSLGTYLPQIIATGDGIDQNPELDPNFPQFNAEKFERAALRALGLETARRHNSRSQLVPDKSQVYRFLSRMFSVEEIQHSDAARVTGAPRKLKVLFLKRELCNSLIEGGIFTAHHVEMALKHYGVMPFTSKLVTGTLIQALAAWDPSLEGLSSVLASPLPLSAGELVHALAIAIRSSQDPEVAAKARLLTNGGSESGSDKNANRLQLTNAEVSNKSSFLVPNSGDSDRRILKLTLRRLYAIPSSSVARDLRTELSMHQLRVLVDTLRLEIARSGWLSPYGNGFETIEPNIQDNNYICYIAHLLNCTIDSVGIGGWLLGASTTDELTETADTIGYMKAEISAALEGIEEATYLKGMLGEILLCGKNSLQSSAKMSRSDHAQLASLPIKPMTIVLNEDESCVLPLGLKPAAVVSRIKVGAGGELIRRSARDIGRLKSKTVGKYSFDRITI